MTYKKLLGLLTLSAAAMFGQTVTAVTNAASYVPAGLPHDGVARGAMLVAKGSGLGPATFAVASSFPLQTAIGGTSVKITVGGTAIDCIMYYAGDSQVACIVPSTTPLGTGTMVITANGRAGAAFPIKIVANALGVFTISQSGSGDAVATFQDPAKGAYVTPGNAANPGDVVIIWGTGLGAVTGNEANPAVQSDLTNVNLEAFIGGQSAQVLFRGRNACCSSVDTVYVRVPAGVAGCATPVTFKIGNIVSNTTTIPVATGGRTCTPTTPGINTGDLTRIFSGGTVAVGSLSLSRTVSTTQGISVGGITIPGQTTRADSGGGSFVKVTVPPGAIGLSGLVDIASFGACTVTSYTGNQNSIPTSFAFTTLDAGASIAVNGPNGARTLNRQTAGGLIAYSATFDQTGSYLSQGGYTLTGSGGPQVGAFNTSINVPAPLTWTNQAAVTNVNRAAGVTVNWTGGDPNGYVQILGTSFVQGASANSFLISFFTCTARTNAGTFTVPSIVLLAMPPSGTISGIALPGTLSVGSYSTGAQFTATGIDYGLVTSSVTNMSQVVYQ